MASIDTLTAAIRAALASSRHVLSTLGAATDLAQELSDRLAAIGVESKSAHAASIASDLEETQAQSNAIISRLESALAAAEAARGVTSQGASDSTGASPTAIGVRDPYSIGPAEGMSGLRTYDEAGTAEGNLFYPSGKQNDRPLKATPGETRFRPGEIKPEWRQTKPAQGHIEGNAAADMLRSGVRKAVLFLNTQPCDHGGTGCKTNTAHFLKPECELMINVCGSDGKPRLRKKITGTGEALTDG